jgi:mono/diheme cytochrome c family protein
MARNAIIGISMFRGTARAAGLVVAAIAAGLIGGVAAISAQEAGSASTTTTQESSTTTTTTASPTTTTTKNTVWDGVYTVEQATAGKQIYDRICSECHEVGEAPKILGTEFLRAWFEQDLNTPFTKMRTSMPDDAPGTLPIENYVNVLSYLLQGAGFPAGTQPLTADADRLSAIMIVEEVGGSVPNFSLVQVVGCLAQDGAGAWTLTKGSRPARTREPGVSPATELPALSGSALGTQTFQLIALPAARSDLKGHKVQAKGLLIRNPAGDRITITSIQGLSDTCN